MSISEYFLRVKSICAEILELDTQEKRSDAYNNLPLGQSFLTGLQPVRPQPLFCLGQLAPRRSQRLIFIWQPIPRAVVSQGCNPSNPNPSSVSASLLPAGVRGCLCPDGLLMSFEPQTSPFNNHPKGKLLPIELQINW
ncbi:hypothetical protein V6N11_044767 [Hibiscus sabdariffa]|uniref:Uncharacterized protein n=2 Tax=Hibiscus sabdariffa TaxID=183260 RepID=A0ABR2AC89_9ROSI